MTLIVLVLIVIAWLGWRKAFTEYQRAEMNQRHYQIAMDGWRGTLDAMSRLTREAQALVRTEQSLAGRPSQERVH